MLAVPIYRHYTECMFGHFLDFPAHMACGFLTVSIYRHYTKCMFGRSLPCLHGLLTVPVY